MPDFKKLFGKAKDQAGKHPDQVQKGVDKVQDFADKHLDDKYDDKIQKGGDTAERALGVDGNAGTANRAAPPEPGTAGRQDGAAQ